MKVIIKQISILIAIFICGTPKYIYCKIPTFFFRPATSEIKPDSLDLIFRKGQLMRVNDTERIKLKPNDDGTFKFSPSFLQPVYLLEITFYYSNDQGRKQISVSKYVAEADDNITVIYSKPKVDKSFFGLLPEMIYKFSGKGSTKYKIFPELQKSSSNLEVNLDRSLKKVLGNNEKSKNLKMESLRFEKSAELQDLMGLLLSEVVLANNKNLDTLKKHRDDLSGNIYKYLQYETNKAVYFPWIMDYLANISQSEKVRDAVIKFYYENKKYVSINFDSDSLATISKYYKDYRMYEVMYETSFEKKSRQFRFEDQYEKLKQIKDNKFRDAVLSYFIYHTWFQQRIDNRDKQDSCITDALKFIRSPELRTPILEQQLFSPGNTIPIYSFRNLSGSDITNEDLKGKVYLIDFYFYGCKGCIEFTKMFKKLVYPNYEDNPEFEVLSVNVDEKKANWLKAVSTNLYNEDSFINLSTIPNGWKHSFLRHFKIESFPFALLVDKDGKLIGRVDGSEPNEINKLIANALAVKSTSQYPNATNLK